MFFNDFFCYNRSYHDYPTRNQNAFRIPIARTTLRAKTLKFTATRYYNESIEKLDYTTSIKEFKTNVISYLKSTV